MISFIKCIYMALANGNYNLQKVEEIVKNVNLYCTFRYLFYLCEVLFINNKVMLKVKIVNNGIQQLPEYAEPGGGTLLYVL